MAFLDFTSWKDGAPCRVLGGAVVNTLERDRPGPEPCLRQEQLRGFEAQRPYLQNEGKEPGAGSHEECWQSP